MDGLEVSEMKLSGVLAAASTFRLDSDYYQKAYLLAEERIKNSPDSFRTIESLGLTVDGSAFYPSIEPCYGTGSLPFIRVADVDGIIDYGRCVTIPEELTERFATLDAVSPGDIVLTKGGSVARVGFVTQRAAASRDLIFINSAKLPNVEQIFLYLYFLTDFCNRLLVRSSSQTAQPHLTITLVKHIPIFRASAGFKKAVFDVVQLSSRKLAESKRLVEQAEEALFAGLDLKSWQPNDSLSCTRSAAEVFAAGRFDAEYFRPRYQSLLKLLRRQGKTLHDVARLREDMFTPQPGQPFHYIEIGDLAADGAATSHVVPGEEAPSRATWIVQPGDVITSTVRPIRCLTGLIEPEQAENICSSGFAVLTPKGIPGELLFAYLRLPVICELMDLHTTASMYPAISTTDLMRLPFLLPDDATIKKVKQQITAARAARREAHALLEKAKQAVEVAIEYSEGKGLALLAESKAIPLRN